MAAVSRFGSSRWMRTVLIISVASGMGYVAREQGWFDSLPGARFVGLTRPEKAAINDDVPPPDDPDELELTADALLAQSEPDEATPELDPDRSTSRKRRVQHAQWSDTDSPRLQLDDATDEFDSGDFGSRVANVNFEDEAPVAPNESERAPARGPGTSSADKPVVAGRPAEATRAASASRSDLTGPVKPTRLMERKQIEELIDKGEYVEAQKELSQWYWQKPSVREEILPQLNKLAQALYFSPQPQYYEPYVVKAGDQLRVIGQKYKLSWEYLARLNRVDARKIRMGQKLKTVPGPFAAIIFIDRYELVVHLNGSFVKSYRVGVGKDGTTPVGTFSVKNKIVDPTYYGPDGVLAHDDPKNPLGERWIDIGDSYGIHGTIDPASIGKNESRGCIRMLNSDVEEVYDFLVLDSEVKIQ
jgi:LysM repeat protein